MSTEQNKHNHQTTLEYLQKRTQRRLSDIDVAKRGRYNAASFCLSLAHVAGQDQKGALLTWKAALKAAWRDLKKIVKAAPEMGSYKKYLGGPSSMSYIRIPHLVWPSNLGHTKHEEFQQAKQRLVELLELPPQ